MRVACSTIYTQLAHSQKACQSAMNLISMHPDAVGLVAEQQRKPSQPTQSAGESTNLDILRATAVLCVVVGHFFASARLPFPTNWPFFGVTLFFIHTSFVLMGSLARLELTGFTRPWRLALAFMIRRIFRIYPLSVLFVLLVPVFSIPHFPGESFA